MSGNLDREIGELNGALRALIPALKGVEERIGELERDHAGLEENVKRLREWVVAIADKLKGVDVGDIEAMRKRVDALRAGTKEPKEGIDWKGIVIWLSKQIGTLLVGGCAAAVVYWLTKGGK